MTNHRPLGLQPSTYSYQDAEHYYLEEDCEAVAFIEAKATVRETVIEGQFKENEMLDEIQKQLRAARRKVIRELRKLFAPQMWESGYRIGPIGNSRPMKLWAPKGADGKPTVVRFKGQALTEFWGLSEEGVITDAYGGGCVTQPLASFSLEDLLMLHKWAVNHLPAQPVTTA